MRLRLIRDAGCVGLASVPREHLTIARSCNCGFPLGIRILMRQSGICNSSSGALFSVRIGVLSETSRQNLN